MFFSFWFRRLCLSLFLSAICSYFFPSQFGFSVVGLCVPLTTVLLSVPTTVAKEIGVVLLFHMILLPSPFEIMYVCIHTVSRRKERQQINDGSLENGSFSLVSPSLIQLPVLTLLSAAPPELPFPERARVSERASKWVCIYEKWPEVLNLVYSWWATTGKHMKMGSIFSVLSCPLPIFSALALALTHTHTHTFLLLSHSPSSRCSTLCRTHTNTLSFPAKSLRVLSMCVIYLSLCFPALSRIVEKISIVRTSTLTLIWPL